MYISSTGVVEVTIARVVAEATTTITIALVALFLQHSRWKIRFREQARMTITAKTKATV